MKVKLSKAIDVDIKTKGLEFKVRDNDGGHRGRCYLTQTGLIWCNGSITKKNGEQVSWNDFIDWMNGE